MFRHQSCYAMAFNMGFVQLTRFYLHLSPRTLRNEILRVLGKRVLSKIFWLQKEEMKQNWRKWLTRFRNCYSSWNFTSVIATRKINLTLYVSYIAFQCVDKPTRCSTSYEWSLLFIIWLYMFRTITSPSSRSSSRELYNALVCSCRRV